MRDFAVVGAGLAGTALARRLAESGHRVTCFGPRPGHPPFSSHDDSGRITRILDGSEIWARLAARATISYPEIEDRSGIRFHHPVGVLWSAGSLAPLESLRQVGRTFDVDTTGGLGGWDSHIGPSADPSLLERGAAGHLAPREMLRAQRALARAAGSVFDTRIVTGIDRRNDRWSVGLADGESLAVDRLVIAAGAGSRDLVDLDLEVTGEVVIDALVPDDVGTRLSGLPCIGRLNVDGSIVEGYLTPPMHNGDDWVIKFGAEAGTSQKLDGPEAIAEWMSGTEHRSRLPAMEQALSDLLPTIVFGRIRSRPCFYTKTRSGLPVVDEVESGLVVVTGGNGRMAKSADAVAGLAAPLVIDGTWGDDELSGELFAVR